MKTEPSPAAAPVPFRFPALFVPKFVPSLLLGRRRSMAADAEWLLRHTGRMPVVRGVEHIPEQGPFVLVVNHYQRPYYFVGWNAFLISMLVARARGRSVIIHWMMNTGFARPANGRITYPSWLLRRIFEGVCRVYDLIPIAIGDNSRAPRAAIRQAFQFVADARARGRLEGLGIFPEAANSPDGALRRPTPTAGRLLAEMAERGVPLIAAAVHEEPPDVHISFAPFEIDLPEGMPNSEKAEAARDTAMTVVGSMLPERMWGDYAASIRAHVPHATEPEA